MLLEPKLGNSKPDIGEHPYTFTFWFENILGCIKFCTLIRTSTNHRALFDIEILQISRTIRDFKMADIARSTSQRAAMTSTIDRTFASTTISACHEEQSTDRDVIMGNSDASTPAQEIRSSTPYSTSNSTSSSNSARDYESSVLAKSEIVIWSFEDSSFTYTTESQLRDCITKGKSKSGPQLDFLYGIS